MRILGAFCAKAFVDSNAPAVIANAREVFLSFKDIIIFWEKCKLVTILFEYKAHHLYISPRDNKV
jgi:hypothetical protein